jgi:Bacteriocin-protection, YdeI or OmpD-Associated
MAMIAGTVNYIHFQTAIEPDGKGSHGFKFDKTLLDAARARIGDTVTLAIEPVKEWQEPKVPNDLQKALKSSPQALALWKDVTPMALRNWIRWIDATKNPETRKKRIEVELSKLNKGRQLPRYHPLCVQA